MRWRSNCSGDGGNGGGGLDGLWKRKWLVKQVKWNQHLGGKDQDENKEREHG